MYICWYVSTKDQSITEYKDPVDNICIEMCVCVCVCVHMHMFVLVSTCYYNSSPILESPYELQFQCQFWNKNLHITIPVLKPEIQFQF